MTSDTTPSASHTRSTPAAGTTAATETGSLPGDGPNSSPAPPPAPRHRAVRIGVGPGQVRRRVQPTGWRMSGTSASSQSQTQAQAQAQRDRWDKTQVVATCMYAAATLLIFVGTLLVARSAQQFSANQQNTNLQVAQNQQQESELQTYLDHMTELLLTQHLATSQPGDVVREVARARTLTVLQQLDGKRKGLVVTFLEEAHLIWTPQVTVGAGGMQISPGNPVIDLSGADLRGANLRGVFLRGAALRQANLAGADLREANVSAADLRVANLTGTDLTDAVLSAADLRVATLRGTNLANADLAGTNLSLADLTGADLTGADLSNADLSGATVTTKQIAQASSLRGAVMPNGSKQSRAP